MSVRLALFIVGGVALAVLLFFALGDTRRVEPTAPAASLPAPESSTGASTEAVDATGDQQATWAGHCDTLIGADVSEDCLAALDARFLNSKPYQLPGLAMQAALVEVPDAPTWRELFADPLGTRARALEALSREECAREEGGISPELAEACGADAIAHFAALKALCAKGPRLKFHLRRGLPEVLAEMPATFEGFVFGHVTFAIPLPGAPPPEPPPVPERLHDIEDSDLYWRRRSEMEESYRWRAWAVTKCDRLPEGALDGVFADTPDLRALSHQHDPRAVIDKMRGPSSPSFQWQYRDYEANVAAHPDGLPDAAAREAAPHWDYEANVAAHRRTAPATPRGSAPDAEFAARFEVSRPFDVLEVPGDHNRWETYSCDWSAEQRYEAHRLMGIAVRLGSQWAMTQYRTQRLLDLRYRYDLREQHPVLWQVQTAKYHESPQLRAKAADLALSLAEELDVRIDRDRLLWLVGPASAAEADWEARAIAAFANVNSENSGDSPKPAESPATPQAKRP